MKSQTLAEFQAFQKEDASHCPHPVIFRGNAGWRCEKCLMTWRKLPGVDWDMSGFIRDENPGWSDPRGAYKVEDGAAGLETSEPKSQRDTRFSQG